MEEFFTIHDAQLPKAVNLQPLDPSDVEPVVTGEISLARPRVYRKASGSRLYDFILAGDMARLISPRVISAFEDVTGWSTFPVAGTGAFTEPIAKYAGLVIAGRCLIDNSLSMLVRDSIPGTDRSWPRWRGLFPRLDTWTGHDFSLVTDTMIVICTRRVRDLAVEHELTNVEFRPVADATNNLIKPNAWDVAPSADLSKRPVD